MRAAENMHLTHDVQAGPKMSLRSTINHNYDVMQKNFLTSRSVIYRSFYFSC